MYLLDGKTFTHLKEIKIKGPSGRSCDLSTELFDHSYKYCITDRYEYGDGLNSGVDQQPWCYSTHDDYEITGTVMYYCYGSFL